MSALTEALVAVGFNVRRAEAIEAAILGTSVDASNVAFTPTGNIAATDVQAAIAELDAEKVASPVGTTAISNDAVTYAKIQNVSAQFRALGRNSSGAGDIEEVTLTQLLDWIGSAAQGDILYRGASSWTRLAAGTNGNFLQTQGTGANPQWASVGGGGIATIASGSLPAAATQSIANIPETYAHLVLQLTGVSSNTAPRQPLVRASTDNGSTFDSTVGNYQGVIYDSSGLALTATTLAALGESAGQAAANSWDATIQLFGYQTGPAHTYFARYRTSGGGVIYHTWGTYVGSTNNIDALQILWNGSGNFDAGTYALYGIS